MPREILITPWIRKKLQSTDTIAQNKAKCMAEYSTKRRGAHGGILGYAVMPQRKENEKGVSVSRHVIGRYRLQVADDVGTEWLGEGQ